jgi:trigger factor
VKTDITELPENKVKLSIEVDEGTFEGAIDQAFRKIGREVTIPGFRRGKVPRRVLEARIGRQSARYEALNDALPEYYAQAVRDHRVDVIAPPEFDLTGGAEEGPVCFDAVVEVRPRVEVEGYADVEVEVPSPVATADEVEAELTRLRRQFAELADVDRPADDGDHVSIDIVGSVDGEPLPGLTADDYLYEVGQGAVTPELDEHLRGASTGDVVEFEAPHPVQEGTSIGFRIEVKGVKEQVLPELTDEWVDENTEFDSVEAATQSFRDRIGHFKRFQANMALNDRLLEAVGALVSEVPDAMVASEMQERLHQFGHQLQDRGLSAEQYFAVNDPEDFQARLRETAEGAARSDLALRAIAEAEGLTVEDAEVDEEIESMASRTGQSVDVVRSRLDEADGTMSLRAAMLKRKAVEWLIEHVTIKDQDGVVLDRTLFQAVEDDELPALHDHDDHEHDEHDHGEEDGSGGDPSAGGPDETRPLPDDDEEDDE